MTWYTQQTNNDGMPRSIIGAYPSIAAMNGIIAFWDFDESVGEQKISKIGYPYALRDMGSVKSPRTTDGPLGYASGLDINSFFVLESGLVGDLNLSKFGNSCTVVAMMNITSDANMGFIAGCWGESSGDPRRQYGLFYNGTTYGGSANVVGHISKTGGASPNIPYSRDYSANQSVFELSRWAVAAMTYDGNEIRSYYDGRWEPRPTYTEPGAPNGEGLTYSKNPYVFPLGLNSGKLAHFTVGKNYLSNWSNQINGKIGGLAVFNRALSPSEVMKVQRVMYGSLKPAIEYDYYYPTYATGTRGANNISLQWKYYYGSTCLTGNVNTAFRLEFPTGGSIRYLGRVASATPSIVYDDESFGIPLAECTKISLKTNNLSTSDLVYPIIKVAGSWYASTTPIQQTVAGVSITDFTNEELHEISNLSNEQWRLITLIPGTTLSVAGTGATLPTNSLVDAIGVYSPTCSAQLCMRNLSLWAPLV